MAPTSPQQGSPGEVQPLLQKKAELLVQKQDLKAQTANARAEIAKINQQLTQLGGEAHPHCW